MTSTRDRLTEIAAQLRELAHNGNPTSSKVRFLRRSIEECEQELATVERRARQAVDMTLDPYKPAEWVGDIASFASDLSYHANRTGNDVLGRFNGVLLTARPGHDGKDVSRQYFASKGI